MPEQETIERAREDEREGKSPSTQAGEFVREEMEHIRERKHGARSTKQAIAKLGFEPVVADEGQLLELVRKAIAANPKAVADFKKGKTKAADAIKGAVMRETRGSAKMEAVQRLLLEELAKFA